MSYENCKHGNAAGACYICWHDLREERDRLLDCVGELRQVAARLAVDRAEFRRKAESLTAERDRLREELAELRAQVPVAWRYQDGNGNYRYRGYVAGFDVDYRSLKPVPLYAAPPAVKDSLTTAAPVPAQVPDDYVAAMDMLSLMFESYENGVPCNDSPDEAGASYIGQAFRLNDVDFKRIADILNKYRPVVAAAHKGGE